MFNDEDVAKHISVVTKLGIKKSRLIVQIFVEAMVKGLVETNGVTLKNLGTFKKSKRKRPVRLIPSNINMGQIMQINGRREGMKEAFNAGEIIDLDFIQIYFTMCKKTKQKIKDKIKSECNPNITS